MCVIERKRDIINNQRSFDSKGERDREKKKKKCAFVWLSVLIHHSCLYA